MSPVLGRGPGESWRRTSNEGASRALAIMDCTMGNRWWDRPRREQRMLVCQRGVYPKVS